MPEVEGGLVERRRKDPQGKGAAHLKELGIASGLPQNFFQDFEDRWRFLPRARMLHRDNNSHSQSHGHGHGHNDNQMDRWIDGWINGWMDGWMDGWIDR
eukprot:s1003_g1.t1